MKVREGKKAVSHFAKSERVPRKKARILELACCSHRESVIDLTIRFCPQHSRCRAKPKIINFDKLQALLLLPFHPPLSSLTSYCDSIFTFDDGNLISPGRVHSAAASATTKPENKLDRRFSLDVVLTESAAVFQSTKGSISMSSAVLRSLVERDECETDCIPE